MRKLKFTFSDITNNEMYSTAKIMIVMGQYSIFNNIVIDELRDRCKPEEESEQAEESTANMLEEFNIDSEDDSSGTYSDIKISNTINLETFIKINNVASLYGKWFCSIDYSFMSKKQKEWLNKYMKSPSDNGVLVVYSTDFRDYKYFLKNKIVLNSTVIHAIQLSFPSRNTLETIVKQLFEDKGVYIEQKALELFIMRMSSSYDQYDEIIDKIIIESVPTDATTESRFKPTITYDNVLQSMKGIENFVLDDFLNRLLVPLTSEKSTGRNKIYRMLGALLKEMGPRELVNKLRYKIDDYIDFRLAINSGNIPIMVKFSVPEAKERLGEKSKITRFSDYTFRKMAKIASQTSLRDWVYMKMMLTNIQNKYSETSYEKALYSLISRTVLTNSRLNNDIGIDFSINASVRELDEQPYIIENLLNNKNKQDKQEETV